MVEFKRKLYKRRYSLSLLIKALMENTLRTTLPKNTASSPNNRGSIIW